MQLPDLTILITKSRLVSVLKRIGDNINSLLAYSDITTRQGSSESDSTSEEASYLGGINTRQGDCPPVISVHTTPDDYHDGHFALEEARLQARLVQKRLTAQIIRQQGIINYLISSLGDDLDRIRKFVLSAEDNNNYKSDQTGVRKSDNTPWFYNQKSGQYFYLQPKGNYMPAPVVQGGNGAAMQWQIFTVTTGNGGYIAFPHPFKQKPAAILVQIHAETMIANGGDGGNFTASGNAAPYGDNQNGFKMQTRYTDGNSDAYGFTASFTILALGVLADA